MFTKKTKIMHGMREVAGQAYYSVKGLKDNGYAAELILWDESPAKYPYDKCLEMHQEKKWLYGVYLFKVFFNFLYCAFHYEVFHFHFGHSLLPKNLDLPFLRLFKKKKIFFEFHGSDLRQGNIAIKKNPYFKEVRFRNDKKLIKRAKKLIGYADGIVIHDDEQIPHIPTTLEKIHLVPLRMDLSRFKPLVPSIGKTHVTIVHAPSSRAAKGSRFIIQTVEILKKKYPINFILVEKMTQIEAFEQYKKADIIIDQIIGGTYGVFAIEAMALGKPVITYITDEMKQNLPAELPIVSANPDDLEEVLEELIQNENKRVSLGNHGVEYVRKYHDCDKNAKILVDIYAGNHVPKFGREAFEEAASK